MFGRITKKITELIANRNKVSFKKEFDPKILNGISRTVSLRIVSFSGERQLEDQLYSIASFYTNIGVPDNWTVFSDGTHHVASMRLLSSVKNVNIEFPDINTIPSKYREESNPLIKKLFYFRSVLVNTTTLFVDSDVLFYKLFASYLPLLKSQNWFLVDEGYGYFDSFYMQKVALDIYPCNSGLLIFNDEPEWQKAIEYLDFQKRFGRLEHWTEQTAIHIMTRGFKTMLPLDPRYFVVGGRDSFKFSFDYDPATIAIRHFVGPVRHKMWQYSWRKTLRLGEMG